MAKPKILVTGATGRVGNAVARQLLQKGYAVRAYVRHKDHRSETLARAGAEIFSGDLYDPQHLLEAMKDVQRGFYLPPFQPYMIQSATAFAVAASQANLEQIVGLTQWTANPSHPSILSRQHWLADRMFSLISNRAHTIVRPGFFADNYLRLINIAVHLGIFPALYGNSRNAPPSNEDIARVCVASLEDPARHDRQDYRPTGPVLLSDADIARILSKVLKRKVKPVPMPRWLLIKAVLKDGVPPFELDSLLHYIDDHRRGVFEMGAPTSVVRDLTGVEAEDFETIAWRYAKLPFAARSLSAWWKTVSDFSMNPLGRTLDINAYEKAMEMPQPQKPVLSADYDLWRKEREIAAGTTPILA